MYERLAWDSFCKTGDIESFLEYKKLSESGYDSEDMKGEFLSESNKSQGNSNKGNTI